VYIQWTERKPVVQAVHKTTTALQYSLYIYVMFDTNRPSCCTVRHITVDLYRASFSSDVHRVDALSNSVDLRTVTWSCDSSHCSYNNIQQVVTHYVGKSQFQKARKTRNNVEITWMNNITDFTKSYCQLQATELSGGYFQSVVWWKFRGGGRRPPLFPGKGCILQCSLLESTIPHKR